MYMLKNVMSLGQCFCPESLDFIRIFFYDNNAIKHIYFCCESHKVEHNLHRGEGRDVNFFPEHSTFLYI